MEIQITYPYVMKMQMASYWKGDEPTLLILKKFVFDDFWLQLFDKYEIFVRKHGSPDQVHLYSGEDEIQSEKQFQTALKVSEAFWVKFVKN